MDGRTLAGKTLFFALICVFVSVFSNIFGQGNSLAGVIIIVLALTMLSRDLSVRPAWNLLVMLAAMVSMGLCSYVAAWSGVPAVGAAVSFLFVFCVCFYAMHDLNSPMHFPFLLGYTFMLSVPVPLEDMPVRMAALAVGAVLVVGLNVLFHWISRDRREREGIIAICVEVSSLCTSVSAGAAVDTDRLDDLCARMDGYLYERLKSRFLSRPGDRRMLDIVVSLQVIGTAVCRDERDQSVLSAVSGIMDRMREFQGGDDMQPLLDSIDTFLRGTGGGHELRTALKMLRNELWRLSYGTADESWDTADVPVSFRVGTVIRENLRRDSVRFTFSLRMALVFSVFVFIWQQWDNDNARALAFAAIAMVQPYLEGTAKRTAVRLASTLVGVLAAIASLIVASGDVAVLTAIMLAANYIFTVLSPMRYGYMMAFVTLSSLLTAAMSNPPETIFTERLAFVFAGIVVASLANRLILPYRLHDENVTLSRRYLDISLDQIRLLGESASGRHDALKETALILKAATISSKIRMNVTSRRDLPTEMLLSRQDDLTARMRLLSKSLELAGSDCRKRIAQMSSAFDPDSGVQDGTDLSGLDQTEADLVGEAADILDGYRRDRMIFARTMAAGDTTG